ncbi:unnamed protein product [Tuber aestivum]|uniref:Uncharacterized protein n=1 Tax=Tuber aestivum TaxID=59557 RepID=A0A292Q722_9PEZI|nr:unnamed protein product [Tuber aestivum]
MPRPFKWGEYFNKDTPLPNRSNKYQVTCLKCQKKIPKGRSEDRTRHLIDECPGLSPEERMTVVEVDTRDREVAEAAAEDRNATGNRIKRPRNPWVKSDFTEAGVAELSRLLRAHHPVETETHWAVVLGEYNLWAQGNGYKKRTLDSLKKQWESRVMNAPGVTAYNCAQDTSKYAWDTDERGDMGMPVTGDLENAGNEGDTDLEASYDSGLIATAVGPSYPIARASLENRFSESQPPASTPLPLPPAKRPRGRPVCEAPTATVAPRPAESSSLVKVLERINEEKAKQIEKLEAKIEKLEEKLEKLDDWNRKLESRSRVLELQLMARKDVGGWAAGGDGGNGGGKRKRGDPTDLASLARLEEGGGDGDGGEAI